IDRWRRATAQEGQAVVLVGQGGVGKSRLMVEASDRIGRQGAPAPIILQYSPFHSNAPLYPVIRQLARLARFASEDPAPLVRGKLVGLLGEGRDMPLIAELLGLRLEEAGVHATLGPVVKRHRTIAALVDWFVGPTRQGAATIVFEDVQWIDPTSRLLL